MRVRRAEFISSFVLSEWDANDDLRALARRGMNPDTAADLGGTLAHEAQAELPALGRFQHFGIKACAVVVDGYLGAAVVDAEADVDAARAHVSSRS